jgi:ATP-dependent helicase/nuclease subunit A
VTTLNDAPARRAIRDQLDQTLFVEAGAGSGKTQSLVDRVVATVLHTESPVALERIAVVTFTDKAAAELRDRLRAAFEREVGRGGKRADRAIEALDHLDTAAIGTLHSFARRILTEHPIEAGLPPLAEVLDEVASGVTFDSRWTALRAHLLDDPEVSGALLLALAGDVRLDQLRAVAQAFTHNWDLLAERVIAAPADPSQPLDVTPLVDEARRLAALRQHCIDHDDKLLPQLTALERWAERLAAAPDDPTRVAILGQAVSKGWSRGRQDNWPTVTLRQLRDDGKHLAETAASLRGRVLDPALRLLARHIAAATLNDAEQRRGEGRLEFHDLLVLARDVLRHPEHGPKVRRSLRTRHSRLLLDEFQDTDPIQIELAIRIAGGADAHADDWADNPVPPGALFIVGDPKQSIYGFRRADIATYLRAQQHVGGQVVLDTNFRTCAPILDWVNHVFGQLINPVSDMQPAYRPLRAHRGAAPGGPAVVALGAEPHEDIPRAGELRDREAADVVAAVRTALAERWQVHDQGRWRDVELRDIAVLVPSRTSLPNLEAALDAAGIPYRAEASSLVYRSREVRDLLMAARAADDPSDPLALVSTLRSPLFGCGDDDLWTWRQAGGRWNTLAPPPDAIPSDHPVAVAVAYLKRLHQRRTWLAPNEVLTQLADDRRMFELAATGPRARDAWRQLRFVIDQARAWSDTQHGSLRSYLAWATRQGSEGARVAEAVLPETDTDSLRITTIHAAKGLEYPVVILSGLSCHTSRTRPGVKVIWPRDGGYELKLNSAVQTTGFDVAKPLEEQMSHHERLRLLYVAATRSRDHLVVSLHRTTRVPTEERNRTSAQLLADVSTDAAPLTAPPAQAVATVQRVPAAPPPPKPLWDQNIAAVRAAAARPAAVSASHLEGTLTAPRLADTDPLGEPTDPGLAKAPRDLELPQWQKGRYGTAIGRAVHAVLQSVDLATGDGLDAAVAAQALAEGVVDHADTVARLARAALQSDIVQQAARRPYWRETYVGTVVEDRVLEGIVDLLYRDDDGLVIVDYKTDAVPAAALASRVAYYRPQMAAYATAIEAATGEPVHRCVLLFLTPDGTYDRQVTDIQQAKAQVRNLVGAT